MYERRGHVLIGRNRDDARGEVEEEENTKQANCAHWSKSNLRGNRRKKTSSVVKVMCSSALALYFFLCLVLQGCVSFHFSQLTTLANIEAMCGLKPPYDLCCLARCGNTASSRFHKDDSD